MSHEYDQRLMATRKKELKEITELRQEKVKLNMDVWNLKSEMETLNYEAWDLLKMIAMMKINYKTRSNGWEKNCSTKIRFVAPKQTPERFSSVI